MAVIRRWAPAALLIVPIALCIWTRYAVWQAYFPAPFGDQWEVFHNWRQILADGRLTPSLLFSQHNEHRIPFPRLVYFADILWFRGTNVFNLAATAVVQVFAVALLLKLSGLRTLNLLGWLALTVALSLTLSGVQWENLYWGFQVQFVGVYAAAAWALYLFQLASADPTRVGWRALLGVVALLFVATFTMSNGLFAGIAMVLVSLVTHRNRTATVVAGLTTLALLIGYLWGFQTVAQPHPATDFVPRYVIYLLTYLGNVWSLGQVRYGLVAGIVMVTATLAMFAVSLREPVRDPVRLTLVSIVVFVGMTAGATAFGRLGYGPEQALSSRYTTPVSWLWAAHALFWSFTARGRRWPWPQLVGAALALALTGLVVAQHYALPNVRNMYERILMGSSALVGGIDDPQATTLLYPDPNRMTEFRPFLREHRLGIFARDPDYHIGMRVPADRVGPKEACRGSFDIVEPFGTSLRVVGWGWDLAADKALDRVVIAGPQGGVLGVAVGSLDRADVRKAVPEVDGPSMWVGVVYPRPGRELTAWGVTRQGRLCELGRKIAP